MTPEGAKWCGQMTYPREIILNGKNIYQMPAKELESHYKNRYSTSFTLNKNEKYVDEDLNSRVARFDFDITNVDANKLTIFFAAYEKANRKVFKEIFLSFQRCNG